MTIPVPETGITDMVLAALNMPIQAHGQLGRLLTSLSEDRRTLTVELTAYSPFTIEGDRVERVQLFIGPPATVTTTPEPANDDPPDVDKVTAGPTAPGPTPAVTLMPALSTS